MNCRFNIKEQVKNRQTKDCQDTYQKFNGGNLNIKNYGSSWVKKTQNHTWIINLPFKEELDYLDQEIQL